jgi:hypothetical protein
MAKTDFTSVDDYLASQPEAVQGVLERVRREGSRREREGEGGRAEEAQRLVARIR